MNRLFLLSSTILGALALFTACSDGPTLKSPQSDTQYDDSDNPDQGMMQNPTKGDAGATDASVPSGLVMPNAGAGIGFDDLRYASSLGKVLVPAGRSGNVDLIDPASDNVTAIGGFSMIQGFAGEHTTGTTSADEGDGLIYAIDQSNRKLDVVDPAKGMIVSSVVLGAAPDYVRYVQATKEAWVTEPGGIEILTLGTASPPAPQHAATITVPGGPEALVIDLTRGRAYTQTTSMGTTLSIDLASRAIVDTWMNGCTASHGLALDETRGFLFAACDDGHVAALDVANKGAMLGTIAVGAGIDEIAYDSARARLYAPGASVGTMAVIGVSTAGALTSIGTIPTVMGAHCVAVDNNATTYVCDPPRGQILVLKDSL
jgi:hypothetical protein